MFIRTIYHSFLQRRGFLAIALIALCLFGLFIVAMPFVEYGLTFDLRTSHEIDFRCSGMAAVVLGTLIGFTILSNRQSMVFEMKRSRGLNAESNRKHEVAEKWLREALTCADGFGSADPRRADCLRALTRIARAQGHLDDAEIFGQQAILATQRAWGPDDPAIIGDLEALAEVYCSIARYAQAGPLLEEIVKRREACQHESPRKFVQSINRLGEYWLHIEQAQKAESMFGRALDFAELYFDKLSPRLLPLLVNRSESLSSLNLLDEADALMVETLALARKVAPPHSWSIASCYYQLAEIRQRQGRHQEAEETVRRAIAIIQEINPSQEVVWHDEAHLLGDILKSQGRWLEAEESYRSALHFREQYLAPEDLATARVLESYAELLNLMDRYDEAHDFAHRAKQIRDFHSPFRIV